MSPQPPPPPGWYPDPWRQAPWRWWDGRAWTAHISHPRPATPWLAPHVAVDAERGPARWLRTFVLVDAGLFLLQLMITAAIWREFVDVIRDDDNGDFTFSAFSFGGILMLAGTILRLIWLTRAAEAGKRLGRPARHDPGLAGAGWIIPVVSWWFPYQDTKALIEPGHPNRARTGWWWGMRLTGQSAALVLIPAAFHPVGFQLAIVALGAMAYAAAALIERDLVGDIFASHEDLLRFR